jgi:uncharacterized membrane protein (Fun14 family)
VSFVVSAGDDILATEARYRYSGRKALKVVFIIASYPIISVVVLMKSGVYVTTIKPCAPANEPMPV